MRVDWPSRNQGQPAERSLGSNNPQVRIATWNTKWATPGCKRGKEVVRAIASLDADVIVLTEGRADLLPPDGFIVDAGSDWGYRVDDPDRRKVLMWSKNPWLNVVDRGSETMPSGRFVSGATESPIGRITVAGVCVPWQGAHVTHGRRDRRPWQDHERYLRGLREVLQWVDGSRVIAGDFNQRIPRSRQPLDVAELLAETLKGYRIPTASFTDPQLIDHIAHSDDMFVAGMPTLIQNRLSGFELSDHIGVSVDLVRTR